MTDAELDSLESAAKAVQDETEGTWDVSGEGKAISAFITAANPAAILELIAELRRTKASLKALQAFCTEKLEPTDD